MTPDKYTVALTRITEAIETLRELGIPAEVVHSIGVQHWSGGTQVEIHVNGESQEHRKFVDHIGDRYNLPPDDGETTNYTRGNHLGQTPVLVFCGRHQS